MTPLVGVALGAAAICATAQPAARSYRIGFIAMAPPAVTTPMLGQFRDAMAAQGYAEGRNLLIVQKWTDGTTDPLPQLARELVASKVDVIVAWGTPPVMAAMQATPSIPIVMVGVADPIGAGLVRQLARPGANVTGTTNMAGDNSGKILELMTELVPNTRSLAVLRNSLNAASDGLLREVQAAALKRGVQLQVFSVRRSEELDDAFVAIGNARVNGVIFLADPMFIGHRDRIAELALKQRLPTGFARRENVGAGGLFAYGPNLNEQIRRAAVFVDRILRGTSPGDLPVEQPTKHEFVINGKTAKLLGLPISQAISLRADEIIE